MRFFKMHGCGNDYVLLDGFDEALPRAGALPELARRLSDRHTGIGADGLILLLPSRHADARMVMYNADGSRAEMCGNGLRLAAKLAWDRRHCRRRDLRFETGAGILDVHLHLRDSTCVGATVQMGRPRLTPAAVPVVHPGPGPKLVIPVRLQGRSLRLLAVGMGNPHAVCFVRDPDAIPLQELGPLLEHHPRFPRRTNVEFVARCGFDHGLPLLRQRTWERGAGETQACGTGACAVLVAAILMRKIPGRKAILRLNGGDLRACWPSDDASVQLSGPAVTMFAGDWLF
jgi:diaminopimelate epimerase